MVFNSHHSYRTSDNAIAGVVVTFADTTERQMTEQTLAKAMDQVAKVGKILDTMSDALFVIGRDWRFAYVNTQGLDFVAKTKEQVLGASVWDVFPELKGTQLERCLRGAMRESKRDTCEFQYKSLGKRAEHHLYPTGDGLLEFVTEVPRAKEAAS